MPKSLKRKDPLKFLHIVESSLALLKLKLKTTILIWKIFNIFHSESGGLHKFRAKKIYVLKFK